MGHSGIMCNFLCKRCATMLFCNMLSLNRHCALELNLKLHNMKQQTQVGDGGDYDQSHLLFYSYSP